MAYTFNTNPTAKITAKFYGESTEKLAIVGTNASERSADNAAAQINKLYYIASDTKQVVPQGMVRTISEEAVDDG